MPHKAKSISQRRPRVDARPSAAERGYGHQHQKDREAFLAEHPLCACGQPASVLDHRTPRSAGGADHPSNYRAMCRPCHGKATSNYTRFGINEVRLPRRHGPDVMNQRSTLDGGGRLMPTPDFTSPCGRIALYQADCYDVLPSLDPASCIIADVPYGQVSRDSAGLRNLDKGAADDDTDLDIRCLVEQFKRLAPTSYVWCSTEQVSEPRRQFVRHRMTTRQGTWIKSNPSPMNGQHLWASAVELCVIARRPKATFNRCCEPPVWRGPSQRVQGFSTPKPVWLFIELLDASTELGDVVIDPFLGSGTTALAALAHGRRCIGIERDPAAFDLAVSRIETALAKGAA